MKCLGDGLFQNLGVEQTRNDYVCMSQRKDTLFKIENAGISRMFLWGKLDACYTAIYALNKNTYTGTSDVCYTPEYSVY